MRGWLSDLALGVLIFESGSLLGSIAVGWLFVKVFECVPTSEHACLSTSEHTYLYLKLHTRMHTHFSHKKTHTAVKPLAHCGSSGESGENISRKRASTHDLDSTFLLA